MFLNYDFSVFINTEKGQQFMHELLGFLYYFARKLPSKTDKFIFPILKRRKYLSDIVLEKLDIFLKNFNFNIRNELKQFRNRIPRKVLLNQFSSPYPSIEFDHNIALPTVFIENLPLYTPHESYFKEGRHCFNTAEERNLCINSYERLCKFN